MLKRISNRTFKHHLSTSFHRSSANEDPAKTKVYTSVADMKRSKVKIDADEK